MALEHVGQSGQVLKKTGLYHGPIFDLVKEEIKTPDGLKVERDLIDHGNAVTILAMTADEQVVVSSEYRVGPNQETIGLPAGLLNTGEDPVTAAERELQEEAGYVAHDTEVMTTIASSEGFTNEEISLVLTHFDPSEKIEKHFDQDEFVNTQLVPFNQLLEWLKDGRILSAQANCTLMWYQTFIRSGK